MSLEFSNLKLLRAYNIVRDQQTKNNDNFNI